MASPRHSPGPVPHLPRLHVLTTAATGPRAVAAVGRVLAAGAPLVQLRAEGPTTVTCSRTPGSS